MEPGTRQWFIVGWLAIATAAHAQAPAPDAGLPAEAAGAPSKIRIAVLDFKANGARPELAAAAVGIVANELQKLGAFEVVTAEAVANVLALERQKQLVGCADESNCLVELANAMGVAYLLSGKVTRVEGPGGANFTLELALIRAADAHRESSDVQAASSEAELLALVGVSATRITSKLLGGNPGVLLLVVSEAGAVVKIDGSAIGTTPLPGQLPLNPGPHLVTLEKEGFVRFQREVRLRPGEVIEEKVILLPSPDFIAHYESRASKLRVAAWVTSGLAVAGLIGGGIFQGNAERLYGSPATPSSFLYYRARLAAGVENEAGIDNRQSATSLKAAIDRDQILSYVAASVGVLAGVAAVVFWVIGDDPGRYKQFHTLGGSF